LNHWDDAPTATHNTYPDVNSGNLAFRFTSLAVNDPALLTPVLSASKTFQLQNDTATGVLRFSFEYLQDVRYTGRLVMEIKFTKNGIDRWLWDDNGIKWTDQKKNFVVTVKPEGYPYKLDVEIDRPLDEEISATSDIYIGIYAPKADHGASGNARTIHGLFRRFQFGAISNEFEEIDYKEQDLFNIYAVSTDASDPPQQWAFTWGMAHPTYDNHHNFTQTGTYNRTGQAIDNAWMKEPNTDQLGTVQPLKQWMIAELTNDNSTVTRKIKGSFVINSLTADILPYRIVQDREGRYYQFVSGEYDDKYKTWNNAEFIEFKGYKT
jgi:hypothetical protein